MNWTRRKKAVVAGLLAVAAMPVVAVAPALADSRDGRCESGEFCLYYYTNQRGSVSDFRGSIANYGATQPNCYVFKGPGAGRGKCVKNRAESVWNRSGQTVRVYFNTGYGGIYQDVAPGAKVNLKPGLKNDNASHRFLGSTTPTGCSTDGSNTRLPSTILVYRTQLGRVDRVGFNTYVKNVLPNEWIASWPRESLKSGAMAVKSYAWYWALHSSRKTPYGECYDVRDDTGDQVYRPGTATASTNAAVDATWTVRLTRDGAVLMAHYCATSTACGAWVAGDWLSQYGSRDLANQGQGYATILRHYYRDASVG